VKSRQVIEKKELRYCHTVIQPSQTLKFVPRYEFEIPANENHSCQSFRKASSWLQFASYHWWSRVQKIPSKINKFYRIIT